ncbi:MAG: hypothetical protein IJ080_07715 [Oscillospiraceae bacterium]|nr:hypothetical protein [Oscillospiraceae bacterium]MBQ8979624.1 hypothetical protein [Oscillospiraceae bacterium]
MNIEPFYIVEEEGFALCLETDGTFHPELFALRADEGFEGNGYDVEAVAVQYLNECAPYLIRDIIFDSEAGMFVAMSEEREPLEDLAEGLCELFADEEKAKDLFSRAEII